MQKVLLRSAFYLSVFFIIFAATSMAGWQIREMQVAERSAKASGLFYKLRDFSRQPDQYDMVFIGDSRSFCALHPELLDPKLGTKSVNLSHWSNWMLLQHAEMSDLKNVFPDGMTIVWSLGHINFSKTTIRPVYPPGLRRLPEFVSLGASLSELLNAQMAFTPWTVIWPRRQEIYTMLQGLSNLVFYRAPVQQNIEPDAAQVNEASNRSQDHELLERFRKRQGVSYVKPWLDSDGRVMSVGQYMLDGSYYRTEVVPEYYRQLQSESSKSHGGYGDISQEEKKQLFDNLTGHNWDLFISTLDLFKTIDVRVILNVLEEAPHTYASQSHKKAYREFMNTYVRSEVEKRGFAFTSVDFDQMGDELYFDYNHMNERGARAYTELLAPRISKILETY
ncbi:hypothetical protein LPB41_29860 [Thalassospira sp. MA62]|nr:hypothetical protein [Thalassospira sp. MA62]